MKEAIDQFAHLSIGAAATWLVALAIPALLAYLVMMAAAIVREHLQHPWQCAAGCRLDLLFYSIGGAIVLGI